VTKEEDFRVTQGNKPKNAGGLWKPGKEGNELSSCALLTL
jgi:hypothetical protein